ncbi:sensor histidine kinase regulating citrate/malate metabolism [Blastococcus colisei]|uniref:histidine kinase n=1 Tax=Blastococcus colisei TaxID=1564162 RepID=A0A543PGM1_9ACTN|nr:sensor histidine kinase [Blastococcus colisei]TQN43225.1 sensor histidine kinase regulating citrate/malate metabolism [Blastococcus colisei]
MRRPDLPLRRRSRPTSLARQLLLLQGLVVAVIVLTATAVAYVNAQRTAQHDAEVQARAIVGALTNSPLVVDAVTGPRPTEVLQPYVEAVRSDTGTSFITVFAPDRTRYTHPDPSQIGRSFIGTIQPALAGRTFTETYAGTLGPSVRATGPIFGPDGEVVGLVSAGITLDAIGADLARSLPGILGVGLVTLAVGSTGSWLISRRLRRQTRGLGAPALARMLDYYQAVLHAVREGLLVVDGDRRVQLVNDEARRLLSLDADPGGRPVSELNLSADLTETLWRQQQTVDEVHVSGGRVLVVNQVPARASGNSAGAVVTLRDHTELQALTGELDSVRAFAESLRAQAHEAGNRLHTTVSLIELGREQDAVEFATAELASAQRLTDRVVDAVEEPVLAALLLGKSATAHERGVRLEIDPGTAVAATGIPSGELVTIVGNLLDNAIDAALAGEPPREVQFAAWVDSDCLEIRVEDSGPGVAEHQVPRVFERGWTTKDADDKPSPGSERGLGLALVAQAVRRNGGSVTVRPGPGAQFSVSLPVRAVVEAAP